MGERFLQRARAASKELDRAQDELKQLKGAETGRISVSLSTVPHMALLPSVINTFFKRYPLVRLNVVEALGFQSIETRMRSGAIDVYIGVAPTTPLVSGYHSETLFRNQRFVIGRAGHPQAGAAGLAELVETHWVTSNETTAENSFAATFRKHNLPVPQRLTYAGSILSQVTLLFSSEMLMIGPKQLLELEPYQGRLEAVRIAEQLDAPEVVLVQRAAAPLTPAAEYFCDLIRRACCHM